VCVCGVKEGGREGRKGGGREKSNRKTKQSIICRMSVYRYKTMFFPFFRYFLVVGVCRVLFCVCGLFVCGFCLLAFSSRRGEEIFHHRFHLPKIK